MPDCILYLANYCQSAGAALGRPLDSVKHFPDNVNLSLQLRMTDDAAEEARAAGY